MLGLGSSRLRSWRVTSRAPASARRPRSGVMPRMRTLLRATRRAPASVGGRQPGQAGASYRAEVVALNERAKPRQRGPILEVDTAQENDLDAITAWVRGVFRLSPLMDRDGVSRRY